MSRLIGERERALLPALYACENAPDPAAEVKLFMPGTRWTWYLLEFDGDDTLFGYVKSGLDERFDELGYISLSELEALVGPFGLRVERDVHWEPTRLSVLQATTAIV